MYKRQAQILSAVIEEYVKTGLPVGSRAIARRYQLGVSPATIRNEMGDLEEMGYLGKTCLLYTSLLARTIVPPLEIPVGVITSLCGAPFFLYLLAKTRKGGM